MLEMNSNLALTNLEKIKQINSRLNSKNIDEVENNEHFDLSLTIN